MMTELNTNTFQQAIDSEIPVLVDFWAPWCMPCRMFSPVLEELSDELDGAADFCKVNIDDHPDLAQKFGVVSIPTVVVFKSGEEVDRFVGLVPKEKVADLVKKHAV